MPEEQDREARACTQRAGGAGSTACLMLALASSDETLDEMLKSRGIDAMDNSGHKWTTVPLYT